MSGQPGKSLQFSFWRYPKERTNRPTIRSGVVFRDFTLRMMLLRSTAENVSMFCGSLIYPDAQFNVDSVGALKWSSTEGDDGAVERISRRMLSIESFILERPASNVGENSK